MHCSVRRVWEEIFINMLGYLRSWAKYGQNYKCLFSGIKDIDSMFDVNKFGNKMAHLATQKTTGQHSSSSFTETGWVILWLTLWPLFLGQFCRAWFCC